MSLKYLLVGSGGREHAIAACLAESDETEHVYVAPGNGGTQGGHPKVSNVDIQSHELSKLAQFAIETKIQVTMVGPEIPLAAGIVDLFEAQGLKCFGPTRAAARLESSKAFAKAFMDRWTIPTAKGASFTDYQSALDYLRDFGSLPVLKASGLAAGKGVVLPDTLEAAEATLKQMMLDGRFGDSGDCVVIEERLVGYEISLLAVCDGASLVTLPAARDHKRLLNGDKGPNTGGMGAVAPVLNPTCDLHHELTKILQTVLDGMAAEDMPYTGILYGGFMITDAGPKVLEFNCRFGDPETQAVLPLLPPNALNQYVVAALNKTLCDCKPIDPTGHSATIVMASGGYPNQYKKGLPISGLKAVDAMTHVHVFHAGTILKEGLHHTSGGRVLAVTGLGTSPDDALVRATIAAGHIQFDGQHYRTDIGLTLT